MASLIKALNILFEQIENSLRLEPPISIRDETLLVFSAGPGVDPHRSRRSRWTARVSDRNRGRKCRHGRWRTRHDGPDWRHTRDCRGSVRQSLSLRYRPPPHPKSQRRRCDFDHRGNGFGRLRRLWRARGGRGPPRPPPPVCPCRTEWQSTSRDRFTSPTLATTACAASTRTARSRPWQALASRARPAMAARQPRRNWPLPATWWWMPRATSISPNSMAIASAGSPLTERSRPPPEREWRDSRVTAQPPPARN